MFAALFGKSKKEKQPSLAIPLPSSQVAETTYLLSQKIDDLERRNLMLATKSRAAAQEAIELNKANKKQNALMLLNKHKMYEKEIETNNALVLKLMMQRTTVETTNMNTETFNVMQIANQVVKSQQKSWTPDKVADLTDEMNELMSNQAEINDMISTPLGGDMLSMADLDAELAALEEPSVLAPAEAAAAAVEPLPEFPAVPVHTPKVADPKVADPKVADMDRELAALEAMM